MAVTLQDVIDAVSQNCPSTPNTGGGGSSGSNGSPGGAGPSNGGPSDTYQPPPTSAGGGATTTPSTFYQPPSQGSGGLGGQGSSGHGGGGGTTGVDIDDLIMPFICSILWVQVFNHFLDLTHQWSVIGITCWIVPEGWAADVVEENDFQQGRVPRIWFYLNNGTLFLVLGLAFWTINRVYVL